MRRLIFQLEAFFISECKEKVVLIIAISATKKKIAIINTIDSSVVLALPMAEKIQPDKLANIATVARE